MRQKSRAYIVSMNTAPASLVRLSNADLVTEVARLAARERESTAALVAALLELDTRRLYLAEGCSSLFTYCVERLHLSEHAAYRRIEAARTARRFPLILERLEEGALTLTAVGLIGPHLTEENHREVIEAARHRSKRAVEELVAALRPQPDVPTSIRRLPTARVSTPSVAAPTVAPPGATAPLALRCVGESGRPGRETVVIRPAVVRALAPSRYHLQMTLSAETHAKLRQAQDLLRHSVPDGDAAAVFDLALTALLEQLARTKFAAVKGPRPLTAKPRGGFEASTAPCTADSPGGAAPPEGTRKRALEWQLDRRPSRAIPAAVRRTVWARSGGQCEFIGATGRCSERGRLEFHHRVPFAAGGPSTEENIAVHCRSHNEHEADAFFWFEEPPSPARSIGGEHMLRESTCI